MAPFRAYYHHVQGVQGPFELQPVEAPAAGRVWRGGTLAHQALISAGLGFREEAIEVCLRDRLEQWREMLAGRKMQRLQPLSPRTKRINQETVVAKGDDAECDHDG